MPVFFENMPCQPCSVLVDIFDKRQLPRQTICGSMVRPRQLGRSGNGIKNGRWVRYTVWVGFCRHCFGFLSRSMRGTWRCSPSSCKLSGRRMDMGAVWGRACMRPCQAQEKMQPPVQQRDELDREYDARVLSLSYAASCPLTYTCSSHSHC